jgi:hypothetical protein
MKARKKVSPAVIDKNRQNSKQSTGPKTPQGKRNSSFNALKHGLTAQVLMFTSDGEPIDQGLAEVFVGLQERYGSNDILGQLLIDCTVADYWRLSKGLELERMHFLRFNESSFHPKGESQNILRYNTANRRALWKSLELLEKMQAPADEAPGDEASVAKSAVHESNETELACDDAAAKPDATEASALASEDYAATVEPEQFDPSTNPPAAESTLLDAIE